MLVIVLGCRVATVMGHSMGNAAALHLAASTNLCHSAVFLNGIGLTPHRSVCTVIALCRFCLLSLAQLKILNCI